MGERKQTQQQFLREAKVLLGCTWDELAARVGVAPRALKTYRMPPSSQDFRAMPEGARRTVVALVQSLRAALLPQRGTAPYRALQRRLRAAKAGGRV